MIASGDEHPPSAATHRWYLSAGVISLCAAALGSLSAVLPFLRISGRTFTLIPSPGPGFAARLSVNLLGRFVAPLLSLLGGIGILRSERHRDRWSGLILAAGVHASSLALNYWLARPYTAGTWLAGLNLQEAAGVLSGLAAAAVVCGWVCERRVAPQPPRPDPPTFGSTSQPT
jgi:hypothetical protein